MHQLIRKITSSIKSLFGKRQVSPFVGFFELGQDLHSFNQSAVNTAIIERKSKTTIERILSEQLISSKIQFTLQIGLVNENFYFWYRSTSADNWLNIYAGETFYFRTLAFKKQLIDYIRQHLQLKSDRRLGRLVSQITNFFYKVPEVVAISDLLRNHPRMQGETLHFLLNATNQDLNNIRRQISHIGKGHLNRGRILNPRFPKLEPLRTQLFAAMICDGHLNKRRCLHYTEKDSDRLQIVKHLISKLGDVEFSERKHSNGCTRLNLPAIIGRLLECWGMPVGDRAILNIGLPHTILKANREIKRKYLQELIPEEGSFISRDNCFRWSRTAVLDARIKSEEYSFTPRISHKHIRIISEFGNQTQRSYGKIKSKKLIRLIWGRLKNLKDSEKADLANDAKVLWKIVLANPPKLMKDEVALCNSLGIGIPYNPVVINLFDAGRVSVTWHATTASTTDGIKWALQALPHDKRKRIEVENFLATI